jgi:hypothetical protein
VQTGKYFVRAAVTIRIDSLLCGWKVGFPFSPAFIATFRPATSSKT